MSLSSNTGATQKTVRARSRVRLDNFPIESIFTTPEQMQRFELLRLAFFVLKLRKLHEQMTVVLENDEVAQEEHELAFQRNLLQHAVFQQILTLTRLGAREQAMQIISTCHNK